MTAYAPCAGGGIKKFIPLILFQLLMAWRCPSNLGIEALLCAQAMHRGVMPYTGFQMHIGPLVPCLFYVLLAIKPLVWCQIVFGMFNLATMAVIFKLTRSYLAAGLFILLLPLFDGNALHVETVMICFGTWAMYFAFMGRKGWAALFVLLAALTKQTGVLYILCLI